MIARFMYKAIVLVFGEDSSMTLTCLVGDTCLNRETLSVTLVQLTLTRMGRSAPHASLHQASEHLTAATRHPRSTVTSADNAT